MTQEEAQRRRWTFYEAVNIETTLSTLSTEDTAFHGSVPEILKFQGTQELEDFLVKDLKGCVNRGEYKRSEIGIIYDDKVYGSDRFSYDNRALPMRLLRSLKASGIPTTWVSQDVRSKEMYDVTTDRVSLISIHSSKGLDFDLVYLVGVGSHPPDRGNEADLHFPGLCSHDTGQVPACHSLRGGIGTDKKGEGLSP